MPEQDSQHRREGFEEEVAALYRLLGFEVKQNIDLAGVRIAMMIEQRVGGLPVRAIVECKDGPIDADECSQILARQNLARKVVPDCRWIVVCSQAFSEAIRKELEHAFIACTTFPELLRELVPMGRYVEGLIHDYERRIEEEWKGKDLFIRPDLSLDVVNERMPALEYFSRWLEKGRSNFLTMLGDLGTGKTTLVRSLVYNMALRFRDDPLVHPAPVLIPLKDVRKEVSLEGIVIHHFSRRGLDGISFPRLAYLVRNGRIVLFFDAFDEMADRVRPEVLRSNFDEIRRAADQGGKVVLSCRTHYFKDKSEQARLIEKSSEVETNLFWTVKQQTNARIVYLQMFNDEQIRDYLKKARPETHEEDWEQIRSIYNLLDLAHHPLLLDMIVRTLPRLHQKQSINAAGLYTEYTNLWMDREEKKERILNREIKFRLMLELAWQLWEREKNSFYYRELTPFVEKLSAGKIVDLGDEEIEDVAREMQGATFLVRDGRGNFSFVHRSFQEYFLARRVMEGLRGKGVPVETALDTRRLDRKMIYFLTQLDEEDELLAPLQKILQRPYCKQVSENSLQILYWSGRIRCGSGMEDESDDPRKVREVMSSRLPWGADLQKAVLAGIALEGAVLANALMAGADLTEARLNHAAFPGADLRGAVLVRARCRKTIFSRCDLRKAQLEGADIDEADFSETATGEAGRGQTELGIDVSGGESAASEAHGQFLPIIQLGELTGVQCGAFSPDGRLLACGGLDGVVRLWRIEDGRLLRTLEGHGGEVRSLAFSPDGALLASGSDDNMVRLWDLSTGKNLRTLAGHREEVRSVAFSPDGAVLASGSADKTVRLWEPSTGRTLRILEANRGRILSIAFSPDGALLAGGNDDATIQLWEPSTGESLRILEGHRGGVRSVAFSRDGTRLASGSDDNNVHLWDLSTGKWLQTLGGHREWVRSVSFSRDGTRLASGGDDKSIQLWDLYTGKSLRILSGHHAEVRFVAFSPDGALLASGSHDKTVRLWNPSKGKCLRILDGHGGEVRSITFSHDGALLASGSDDKTVQLWDSSTGNWLRTLEGHRGWVRSVSLSRSGAMLASGSDDNTVRLWDPSTGKAFRTLEGHRRGVLSVSFSPDGTLLASGSYDTTARLWDPSTGKCRHTLEGHGGEVWSVSFSPDGAYLASGSNDKNVHLWEPSRGKWLRSLTGHMGWVRSVAFSPDGTLLASGSKDYTIRLWEPSTGKWLRTLTGHQGEVRSVAFSPDGALLASGSHDDTVQLWESATGERRGTLFGHFGTVSTVVFAPSGRYLIAAGRAGRLQFWDIQEEETFLYRYAFGPGAWLDLLPDGRFDGSPQGLESLCYAEQGTLNSYRAEELAREFHDPEGVREVLARYLG